MQITRPRRWLTTSVCLMLCVFMTFGATAQTQTTQTQTTQDQSAQNQTTQRAIAQPPTPQVQGATSSLANPQADTTANKVVRDWLAGKLSPDLSDAATSDPLDLARNTLLFAAPVESARVNENLRELVGVYGEGKTARRVYRYPMSTGDTDLALIVSLEQRNDQWVPYSVQITSNEQAIPEWVTGTTGAWVMAAFTALIAFMSLAATPWRRWLADWLVAAREYRTLVLATNIALYGIFIVGGILGALFPRLTQIIQEFTATLLQSRIGESLNDSVMGAAAGIFYNNFLFGAFETTFLPGVIFGLPTYLLNLARHLVLGIALTPAALPTTTWLLHLPTIIIELQAYILITAGAGILLAKIIRGGLRAFPEALRIYLKTLPWAVVLLVIAAWYEALEVFVLIPRLTGQS